jgi:hypothetical protein
MTGAIDSDNDARHVNLLLLSHYRCPVPLPMILGT